MIGLIIHGIIDGALEAAFTFFESPEKRRARWERDPRWTVYAPRIVRTFEPWPGQAGGRRWDGPWPYQPCPGDRR